MKGLILCKGLGTGLWPITISLPKQLIPIVNKPVLLYIIDSLIEAGIKEIGIIVNDSEQLFRDTVKIYKDMDIRFEFIIQKEVLGTADAIYNSLEFIGEDNFLTILGDSLYDVDIRKFIDDFEKEAMSCKLLIKEVSEPNKYEIIDILDEKIVDLVEKPKYPPTNLAVTGIYIFDNSIFEAYKKIDRLNKDKYEIADLVKWLINNEYRMDYDILEGWWGDLGKAKDILNANYYKLSKTETRLKGTVDEKSELLGSIIIGENSKIYNSNLRGPVVIGDDSIIENSYIGPYSSIGNKVRIVNSEVENSIILDGCLISNIDNMIDSSIIEKDCVITREILKRKVNSFILGKSSKVIIN